MYVFAGIIDLLQATLESTAITGKSLPKVADIHTRICEEEWLDCRPFDLPIEFGLELAVQTHLIAFQRDRMSKSCGSPKVDEASLWDL